MLEKVKSYRHTAFYPTYEELKYTLYANSERYRVPFYPTYEELKFHNTFFHFRHYIAFYPTYEELKYGMLRDGIFHIGNFLSYL